MVKTLISRLWQNRRFFFFSLTGAVVLISYLVFSQPNYIQPIAHTDKVGHWLSFLLLAFLTHKSLMWPKWLDFIFLASYGILIEVIQSFIPYRSGTLDDVAADIAGILTFYLILFVYKKIVYGSN